MIVLLTTTRRRTILLKVSAYNCDNNCVCGRVQCNSTAIANPQQPNSSIIADFVQLFHGTCCIIHFSSTKLSLRLPTTLSVNEEVLFIFSYYCFAICLRASRENYCSGFFLCLSVCLSVSLPILITNWLYGSILRRSCTSHSFVIESSCSEYADIFRSTFYYSRSTSKHKDLF